MMNADGNIGNHKPDEAGKPSRKKPMYPVTEPLRHYLKTYGREVKLPVAYRDLLNFSYALPLKDKNGDDTLWETVKYDAPLINHLKEGLIKTYAILKTEGNLSFIKHLDVARIDFCSFGNSQPFRIRIVNTFNDNYDYYYIKIADASRIYGLELEHLLSPNRISYLTQYNTIVEEHIAGIPGDIFIRDQLEQSYTNKIRLAKEFVKFNERCFVRLLGDMRSYNFVVDITPDVEDYQYRIRCIDFDQQSYEGRKNFYLPQYYKENKALVDICLLHLNRETIEQYQMEERTMMSFRLTSSRYRLVELLNCMSKESISTPDKIEQLKKELAEYFSAPAFLKCRNMGQIVKTQLKISLRENLQQLQKMNSKYAD